MVTALVILCLGLISCFFYLLLSKSEKRNKTAIIIAALTVFTSICGNLFSNIVYDKWIAKTEKYVTSVYNGPIYNIYNGESEGNTQTNDNSFPTSNSSVENKELQSEPIIIDDSQDVESYENASTSLFAKELNGKWGFVDQDGETRIPFVYDYADNFYEGLAAVRLDYSWGFISTSGETVIPFQYSGAWSFINGLAPVFKNNLWGFINNKGELIIQYQYSNISRIGKNYYDQDDKQIVY